MIDMSILIWFVNQEKSLGGTTLEWAGAHAVKSTTSSCCFHLLEVFSQVEELPNLSYRKGPSNIHVRWFQSRYVNHQILVSLVIRCHSLGNRVN